MESAGGESNAFGPDGVTTMPKDIHAYTNNVEDKVHMLVLETDEPHPDTQEQRGSFGQMFNELFNTAGSKHEPPLAVTTTMKFIVDDPSKGKQGHVPTIDEIPEDTRAIIITGSLYDAHGDDPWIRKLLDLLEQLWIQRPEVKMSGVCFGHQIISRLLGSSVEPESTGNWELAHTEMDLTPVGQKLFRTKDPKIFLHQMHQDKVTSTPSAETTHLLDKKQRVHVWAGTKHTPIQGLYIRDRVFTSQGHLEMWEGLVHEQINARQESGSIRTSERAAEGKESAHLKHDGVVVAGAILRFFHGEDHDID